MAKLAYWASPFPSWHLLVFFCHHPCSESYVFGSRRVHQLIRSLFIVVIRSTKAISEVDISCSPIGTLRTYLQYAAWGFLLWRPCMLSFGVLGSCVPITCWHLIVGSCKWAHRVRMTLRPKASSSPYNIWTELGLAHVSSSALIKLYLVWWELPSLSRFYLHARDIVH